MKMLGFRLYWRFRNKNTGIVFRVWRWEVCRYKIAMGMDFCELLS
jgi:hypothetical protein